MYIEGLAIGCPIYLMPVKGAYVTKSQSGKTTNEQKSIDEEDVRHQIAVWLNRGHIKEVEMDVYEKVNFRSA